MGGNAYSAAGVTLEGEHYYQPEQVPEKDAFYMPIACMQCEKPPCVKVCPVRTTYREPDGIVVIDYNWCIGCRKCMDACPYWARRFNWSTPNLPKEEMNPVTHYLGNRPRMRGVVEKCTWCVQRTRQGRYPACVEVCPVGARKFGNLLDPEQRSKPNSGQKACVSAEGRAQHLSQVLLLHGLTQRAHAFKLIRFAIGLMLSYVVKGGPKFYAWMAFLGVLDRWLWAYGILPAGDRGPDRYRSDQSSQRRLVHCQLRVPGGCRRRRRSPSCSRLTSITTRRLHDVTVLGEMVAVAAVMTCNLFVFVAHGAARTGCGT